MFARRSINSASLFSSAKLFPRRNLSTSNTLARSVIVTGAAQGIGKAIAVQLAEDGYDVCVNDIDAKKQAVEEACHEISTKHGRKALPVTCDVSNLEAVQGLVQQSVDNLGPLNTMVANAGIIHIAPIVQTDTRDAERVFAVNYFGVYNCYRAATEQFLKQGPPPEHPPHLIKALAIADDRVTQPVQTHPDTASKPRASKGIYKLIGAGSVAGYRSVSLSPLRMDSDSQQPKFPNIGHYAASKWAVRGLTQSFALEFGRHGITCNNYAPGIVGTPMWDRLDDVLGGMNNRTKGATMKMEAEKAVLGRVSVGEDVAGTVSWLAGPGSDFVTGQTVVVDGGTFMT
ncbi:MAG: hypothetical protein Q9162_002520 [Coniocarpon cinnabarinum]